MDVKEKTRFDAKRRNTPKEKKKKMQHTSANPTTDANNTQA